MASTIGSTAARAPTVSSQTVWTPFETANTSHTPRHVSTRNRCRSAHSEGTYPLVTGLDETRVGEAGQDERENTAHVGPSSARPGVGGRTEPRQQPGKK